jgi:hypothetical protein
LSSIIASNSASAALRSLTPSTPGISSSRASSSARRFWSIRSNAPLAGKASRVICIRVCAPA